jgi:hypothetical protein
MSEREKLNKRELEVLSLRTLCDEPGLSHLEYVVIGSYSGPKGWTWDLVEAGPDAASLALENAIHKIRMLQQKFDLRA